MLSKLDDRERLFVFLGILLIVVLVLTNVVLKVVDYRRDLTNQVIDSRSNFAVMERYIKDLNYYRSLKSGEAENISDVFAKLDQLMVRYSLKEKIYNQKDTSNIVEKNYNRTTFEFNFRSVVLQDVFKMIYDIEINKSVNGKVTYLNFRKVPLAGKELYDVNLRLSSYSRINKK